MYKSIDQSLEDAENILDQGGNSWAWSIKAFVYAFIAFVKVIKECRTLYIYTK